MRLLKEVILSMAKGIVEINKLTMRKDLEVYKTAYYEKDWSI